MSSDDLRVHFVEFIPDVIEEHTLYVSIEFATVVHRCCCGCGQEVITPLSPTDWKITYDGVHVSLHPSVGNWSFDCRSHYWIRDSRVQWAPEWTEAQINAGRMYDQRQKERQYGSTGPEVTLGQTTRTARTSPLSWRLWSRFKGWWKRWF